MGRWSQGGGKRGNGRPKEEEAKGVEKTSARVAEVEAELKGRTNGTLAGRWTPLYCLCRSPDDGRFMIGCDYCEGWYHPQCVNLKEAVVHKWYVAPNAVTNACADNRPMCYIM